METDLAASVLEWNKNHQNIQKIEKNAYFDSFCPLSPPPNPPTKKKKKNGGGGVRVSSVKVYTTTTKSSVKTNTEIDLKKDQTNKGLKRTLILPASARQLQFRLLVLVR